MTTMQRHDKNPPQATDIHHGIPLIGGSQEIHHGTPVIEQYQGTGEVFYSTASPVPPPPNTPPPQNCEQLKIALAQEQETLQKWQDRLQQDTIKQSEYEGKLENATAAHQAALNKAEPDLLDRIDNKEYDIEEDDLVLSYLDKSKDKAEKESIVRWEQRKQEDIAKKAELEAQLASLRAQTPLEYNLSDKLDRLTENVDEDGLVISSATYKIDTIQKQLLLCK